MSDGGRPCHRGWVMSGAEGLAAGTITSGGPVSGQAGIAATVSDRNIGRRAF